MQNGESVLLYVEDPGAANFFLGLPADLTAVGIGAQLYSAGAASDYLRARGEAPMALPHREPASVLAKKHLDAVAVGTSENPDSPGLALIDAARRASIATVGIVDHDAHAALRFRGRTDDPLAHAPEHLIVPDETTLLAYTQLGFPGARIAVCGHPQLDRAHEARSRFAQQDRAELRHETFPEAGARDIVVFLAEQNFSLDPDAPETADPRAWPARAPGKDRVEAVFESFLDACATLPQKPFIVLRLHPKNMPEAFSGYSAEYDSLSFSEDPLQLLYCADLVVGLTTVLLAEADALGTPVIAAPARAQEVDWLPASLRGSSCIARNHGSLQQMIHGHFQAPGRAPSDFGERPGALARARIRDAIVHAVRPSHPAACA